MEETRPPGLRFDDERPFWRATKAAVKAGYPVKSVNLSSLAAEPRLLRDRCIRLQREMEDWLSGDSPPKLRYDGTFGSLIEIYHSDPKSPFHGLKASTRQPYNTYIRMMKAEIGRCRLDRTDGIDVLDWFDSWSAPAAQGKPRQLAKANMAVSVLKAALTFGVMRRLPGCVEFRVVLDAAKGKMQKPRPRKLVIDDALVTAARKAAHQAGHGPAALSYAIQFEGMARQWDIKGQWLPLADKVPSAVIYKGTKWIGPTWANIDANLILRYQPTKTEDTSGAEVVIDLAACPMVVEELAHIPQDARTGPLIVNPETGLPYTEDRFGEIWRDLKPAAGIPDAVWNRDLRKSGITEAKGAAARHEDVQKVAGHVEGSDVTSKVYDQAAVEAHRRTMDARKAQRGK